MNTRSLRFRLIIWYAGLLTGVFLLCGAAMCQALRHYLKQSLAQSLLRRTSKSPLSLLADVEKTGEAFVVDEIKARYAPENYDRFVRLSRRDGTVIYASGRAATFDPAGLPPVAAEDSPRIALLPDGNRLLIVAEDYRTPSGRVYLVESGGPMQPIETDPVAFAFSAAAGGAGGCAWWRWAAAIFWWGALWRRWCKLRAAPNKSPCIT